MPGGALRVVTLNLWSRLGPWSARCTEAATWIRNLEPDVVLFQEVVREAGGMTSAEQVAAEAGGEWHAAFAGGGVPWWCDEPDADSWGLATISRQRVEQWQAIRLPDGGGEAKPNLLLHMRTGGVDVFNAHLAAPPALGWARQQQVLAVDAAIRELAPADSPMPPVLGGDFNADHDSDEVRFLSGLCTLEGRSTFYIEAMRVAGQSGPNWTLDGANPHLAQLNVPNRRVDFIFVGDAFLRPHGTGRVLTAGLAFHKSLTGTLASDHYGLVVDIGAAR